MGRLMAVGWDAVGAGPFGGPLRPARILGRLWTAAYLWWWFGLERWESTVATEIEHDVEMFAASVAPFGVLTY